jgi:hypothetical protein
VSALAEPATGSLMVHQPTPLERFGRRRAVMIATIAAVALYPIAESLYIAYFIGRDFSLLPIYLFSPGREVFLRRVLVLAVLAILGLALDSSSRRRRTERRLHRMTRDL